MLKTVFPKSNVSRETLWKSFLGKPLESGSARLGHIPSLPWESQLPLKPCLSLQPFWFEGNCDSSDSFLDFCFISLCSLICSANVGCSPTPRQHFWKIAGSKNFYLPAARMLQPIPHKIKPADPCFRQESAGFLYQNAVKFSYGV